MEQQTEPPEPSTPTGRRSHRDRVADVDRMLIVGQTAAVCIDDTDEHRNWYLRELAKYPKLVIMDQGRVVKGVYSIKVRKVE